ncbi:type II toxin-antitoxin system death-on-curing family toxin [Malacoplasma iowae]|uniref:type II toxin-antitoxin system death-on-curing family toxin n=1 Tax=Malacoplasma iowae TaxID=2116 RepID=UPI003872C1AF|nr:type II toxin-antitoxin system death-on-curing family toxin [Malacoplasma iowae]
MKKTVYIFKDDDFNKIFWEENKNNILYLENNNIYFNSKFNGKTKIEFSYSVISIDEDFEKLLIKLIDRSLFNAEKLSEEELSYSKNNIEKIKSIISNTLQSYLYKEEQKIFEFITDLFIKLLSFHPLINGNKRFALSFTVMLLKVLGFYFKWSGGNKENYLYHKEKITSFVMELSNNKDKSGYDKDKSDYDIIRENIIIWIKSNSIVSI